MHKLAYGTDKVPHDHEEAPNNNSDKDELKHLRQRVAELESRERKV
jgi:hypothetical protein